MYSVWTSFECPEGMALTGSASRRCTEDGTFGGTPAQCTRKFVSLMLVFVLRIACVCGQGGILSGFTSLKRPCDLQQTDRDTSARTNVCYGGGEEESISLRQKKQSNRSSICVCMFTHLQYQIQVPIVSREKLKLRGSSLKGLAINIIDEIWVVAWENDPSGEKHFFVENQESVKKGHPKKWSTGIRCVPLLFAAVIFVGLYFSPEGSFSHATTHIPFYHVTDGTRHLWA